MSRLRSFGNESTIPTYSRSVRAVGARFAGGEQFSSQREDLIGITVDRSAEVGEHDRAPTASIEGLAEGRFELLHLSANRGLRGAQFLRCAAHAALPGHGVKVTQVVVVEPFVSRVSGFHKSS